jgi:hypothetical protein
MAICVHGCSALSLIQLASTWIEKTVGSCENGRNGLVSSIFFCKPIGEFEYFWNFEIKKSKKTRGDFKILVKTEFKKLR